MFFIRWLVTAIAVAAAVWIVPGISIVGGTEAWIAIAIFSLILALIDVSIKPILQVISIPITVLTLGIFYLVVNALLLYVASWVSNGLFGIGFDIGSFGSALLASIVISIISTILNSILAD